MFKMDTNLQQALFDQILSRFPTKTAAVAKISEVLNLGRDPIYRRMRGDTILTPDEMSDLARAFHISLDELVFQHENTVFFTYNAFSQQSGNLESYLQSFIDELEKARQAGNPRFYYASAEWPLFQSLFIPELISFKLFIWGRTVIDFPFLQQLQFEFSLIPEPILRLTRHMLECYIGLPSIELWSRNIVDNTLNQILYQLKIDSFKNREDALFLCDKLNELTEHMQKMAKAGRKSLMHVSPDEHSGASFDLYHNEMVDTNNTILANTTDGRVLFTTLGNPNFIKSTDRQLTTHMEGWFEKVILRSNSISQHAEKSRSMYFMALRKKIDQTRLKITHLLGQDT